MNANLYIFDFTSTGWRLARIILDVADCAMAAARVEYLSDGFTHAVCVGAGFII